MHRHPFSGPTQLWWGDGAQTKRPRNLFHDIEQDDVPPSSDMFRAGGLIDDAGNVTDRAHLHSLMSSLDRRTTAVSEPADNRKLPAGYTYLLQFIAHDMVDSVPSFGISGRNIIPGARNARLAPLMLETLYGSSPDEVPHAYMLTERQLQNGLVPRIRLRVGRRASTTPGGHPSPERDPYCPFRDIARNTSQKTADGVQDASEHLTEAMLADVRNDAHALISQLTILFQLLHNHVISLLEGATTPTAETLRLPPGELAYREFECARMVVTLIYRNIIEKDVLRRILDTRIHRRYLIEKKPLLDRGKGIPQEFSFGAFRFAHAIVRDSYKLNSFSSEGATDEALLLSASLAHLNEMGIDPLVKLPLKENWFVDWAHFFENSKGIEPNFSRKIAPHYPVALSVAPITFPIKVPGVDAGGLMHRDLVSAAFAGVLSVPALIRTAREKGIEIIEDFSVWQGRLRTWLNSIEHLFSPSDVSRLVEDPPLPFFVLFEAAGIGRTDEADCGERLGPLGSLIVAETILGSMAEHPLGVEGSTLKERISDCGEIIFNMEATSPPSPASGAMPVAVCAALSEIDEIEGMSALLEYMERVNLFTQD